MNEKQGQKRVLTADNNEVNLKLNNVHSAMIKELSKQQRKTPQRYMEDLIEYFYKYL